MIVIPSRAHLGSWYRDLEEAIVMGQRLEVYYGGDKANVGSTRKGGHNQKRKANKEVSIPGVQGNVARGTQ